MVGNPRIAVGISTLSVIVRSQYEGNYCQALQRTQAGASCVQFVYFRSLVTGYGRYTKEVRRRIALGKRKELLSGTLSPALKKRMISLVMGCGLYDSETTT